MNVNQSLQQRRFQGALLGILLQSLFTVWCGLSTCSSNFALYHCYIPLHHTVLHLNHHCYVVSYLESLTLMRMFHLTLRIQKRLVVLLNHMNQFSAYPPENGFLLVIIIQTSYSKRYVLIYMNY